MRRISQREARRLRKRVEQLEQQERDRLDAWACNWPGIHLASAQLMKESPLAASIRTARKLGHAVVVTASENGELKYYAARLQQR